MLRIKVAFFFNNHTSSWKYLCTGWHEIGELMMPQIIFMYGNMFYTKYVCGMSLRYDCKSLKSVFYK